MHQYASQTSEARELVAELEFVWDQIKFNASSSSSSSPLNTVGVPPLSRSANVSIGGRLAPSEYERPHRVDGDRDSRLRVLSPVSQPEEEYYHRESIDERGEDEDEDEEFEEARDSLYEHDDADHASTTTNTHTDASRSKLRRDPVSGNSIDSGGTGLRGSHSHAHSQSHSQSGIPGPKDSRWRRRVEQALTKMTAEIAAVREQMEARTVAQRRRSGLWAWVKWMVWVAVRQILVDIAMLGMLLIWMRLRGDRRVEDRLKTGWAAVKGRLGRVRGLRLRRLPILP